MLTLVVKMSLGSGSCGASATARRHSRFICHPRNYLAVSFCRNYNNAAVPSSQDNAHSCYRPALTVDILNKTSLVDDVKNMPVTWRNPMDHAAWDLKSVDSVRVTHKVPESKSDKVALFAVKVIRFWFDLLSGSFVGEPTDEKYLRRICYLETIAGVPGMVAG